MTTITVNNSSRTKKNTAKKLLQNVLSREEEVLRLGIQKTIKNLKAFEKKHSLKSKKFFELYQKGQLDDRNDYVDWAGEYQIFESLNEQMGVLKDIIV